MDETFQQAIQQMFWEKKLMDRYLTDPSSVWRVNIAEGGVRDVNVSPQYYQDFLKAQNNARKEVAWVRSH